MIPKAARHRGRQRDCEGDVPGGPAASVHRHRRPCILTLQRPTVLSSSGPPGQGSCRRDLVGRFSPGDLFPCPKHRVKIVRRFESLPSRRSSCGLFYLLADLFSVLWQSVHLELLFCGDPKWQSYSSCLREAREVFRVLGFFLSSGLFSLFSAHCPPFHSSNPSCRDPSYPPTLPPAPPTLLPPCPPRSTHAFPYGLRLFLALLVTYSVQWWPVPLRDGVEGEACLAISGFPLPSPTPGPVAPPRGVGGGAGPRPILPRGSPLHPRRYPSLPPPPHHGGGGVAGVSVPKHPPGLLLQGLPADAKRT